MHDATHRCAHLGRHRRARSHERSSRRHQPGNQPGHQPDDPFVGAGTDADGSAPAGVVRDRARARTNARRDGDGSTRCAVRAGARGRAARRRGTDASLSVHPEHHVTHSRVSHDVVRKPRRAAGDVRGRAGRSVHRAAMVRAAEPRADVWRRRTMRIHRRRPNARATDRQRSIPRRQRARRHRRRQHNHGHAGRVRGHRAGGMHSVVPRPCVRHRRLRWQLRHVPGRADVRSHGALCVLAQLHRTSVRQRWMWRDVRIVRGHDGLQRGRCVRDELHTELRGSCLWHRRLLGFVWIVRRDANLRYDGTLCVRSQLRRARVRPRWLRRNVRRVHARAGVQRRRSVHVHTELHRTHMRRRRLWRNVRHVSHRTELPRRRDVRVRAFVSARLVRHRWLRGDVYVPVVRSLSKWSVLSDGVALVPEWTALLWSRDFRLWLRRRVHLFGVRVSVK